MRHATFRSAPLASLLVLGLLASCQKDSAAPEICEKYPPACTTPATVRDLTGLDGCGKVLALAVGQRQHFAATNGQQVLINYKPTPSASICMVGQTVEITCIHAVN